MRTVGETLGDEGQEVNAELMAEALGEAARAMMELGGARLGDKTMLDALIPFRDKLSAAAASGRSLQCAWAEAVPVARQAAQDTSRLTAKIGRARPQAARGVGTPDAGAVSLALCLEASGLDDCS